MHWAAKPTPMATGFAAGGWYPATPQGEHRLNESAQEEHRRGHQPNPSGPSHPTNVERKFQSVTLHPTLLTGRLLLRDDLFLRDRPQAGRKVMILSLNYIPPMP